MARANPQAIYLQGDLTFSSVELIAENHQFIFADNHPVIFDLSGIEKMDSSVLALLIKWLRCGKQCNKLISFRDGSQQLINLIKLSGLQDIIFW